MTMEINGFSGLEVHCVGPHYQQNDFVIGFVQAMILKSLEPGNLYVLNVKMLDC